jgi:mono/diheme cytochrome c family protein
MPNLLLTLENASTVGAKPVTSYQLLWAGPWLKHSVAQAGPTAVSSPQVLASGRQVFAANCAVCHGAAGEGGAGPNLHGIAKRKSLDQTIAFIENPSGGMPKLYPATLSAEQVRDVADYISQTFR